MTTRAIQEKKRINIELPNTILEKLDKLASQIHSNRSELIRKLISDKLEEKERIEFEYNMKEGYLSNYDFIRESSKEWDFTSGDGL